MTASLDSLLKEGIAAAQAGQVERALEHLREAQRIDPHNPQVRDMLESLRH